MKKANFAVLTNGCSLSLMCIKPCKKCSLVETFKDVDNVSVDVTVTPANSLVLELGLKGNETEKNALFPTVYEMTKQMCAMCQNSR
ncbi:MAG: hypothetical protein IIV74_00425 [Alphaproteobacteria bacterium]|nr:hypothetical protein [Alphaproteobacteria bacterium]